jgi:hypothetical protein
VKEKPFIQIFELAICDEQKRYDQVSLFIIMLVIVVLAVVFYRRKTKHTNQNSENA